MAQEKIQIHTCHGVQDSYTCHYNGACYGEICIDPKRCSKKWDDLSEEEKLNVEKFNKEINERDT